MNIELAKTNYTNTLPYWTHSAIYCYLRGCVCQGCIYKDLLESSQCKMKIGVLLLVAKFGIPTNERMEKYHIDETKVEIHE